MIKASQFIMCYVTQGEGRGFFEICDKALHGGGTGGLKLGKKLLRNLWMAPNSVSNCFYACSARTQLQDIYL